MANSQGKKSTLARATCAALLAASFAVGSSAETEAIRSLQCYCHSSWRQAGIPRDDWEDCTHDTLVELLSRLPRGAWQRAVKQTDSTERRELIRSVWCVTQRWRRQARCLPVSLDLCPPVESPVSDRYESRQMDAELLEKGLADLRPVQREILALYRDGYSIAEIAQRLDASAAYISDQKYKAIRTLKRLVDRCVVAPMDHGSGRALV